MVAWTLLLAFFFAQVEVSIEGAAGWASSLPTWRIEKHWLLDLFWGGRPLTGYHAWVFPFIFLAFHLGFFMAGRWTWRLEARVLGCIALFWIVEDFLWFVLNPAFGLEKFSAASAPWHAGRWVLFMPMDYWLFIPGSIFLLWLSRHDGVVAK